MLLKAYSKEIFRPECNHGFESVHCIAHLHQDIAEVLPYLSYEGASKPKLIEILKLLPKTNCKECGEPTCMVFAARMAEGVKGPEDCPPMGTESKQRLAEYMSKFKFDV